MKKQEMILISSSFHTKAEATIWANRQTQLIKHGAEIKVVIWRLGHKYSYYVARSVVPTDKTRTLLDPTKMKSGSNIISIYDYAKRSRSIVEPNRRNEIKLKRDR